MYLQVFLTIILSFVTKPTYCSERPETTRILTQEIYWSRFKNVVPFKNSYIIAASYVKEIEASGGRVVPVFSNRTTEYYMYVTVKLHFNIDLKNHVVLTVVYFFDILTVGILTCRYFVLLDISTIII